MADIAEGRIASCYLLCGDEEYLIGDALEKIITQIIPAADRDLNLAVTDGDREDLDQICETLLTVPLIPGRKAVVIRNTRIFHSRRTLPAVIQKIRDHAGINPARAAADFMIFLRTTGWTLEDLHDGGWQKISDEQWHQAVEGDDGQDRDSWMPVMAAFCAAHRPPAAGASENTDRLEALLKNGLPDGHHLLLTAEAPDKRKKIFKCIETVGKVLEFNRAKEFNRARGEAKQKGLLMEHARELLAGAGKKMASDAWLALGKKTGFNLRTSMAALEKLITFTGDKPTIEAADIDVVIGKTREETVFNLTAALSQKNLPSCLSILGDLLDQGEHPLMILSMLAREIRMLLQVKLLMETGPRLTFRNTIDYGTFQQSLFPKIRERLGPAAPHPYPMYQAFGHAGRFSRESLLDHMETLARIDLDMKSTAKDARLMLERFLIGVCEK